MAANIIKSLIIHIVISLSAFCYTGNVSIAQGKITYSTSLNTPLSANINLIISISSLLLYFLIGRLYLEDQYSPSKNMISVGIVPLLGMLLWFVLYERNKSLPYFDMRNWIPYMAYVGYVTPVFYSRFNSSQALSILTWIPSVIMFIGIKRKPR